MKNSDFDLTQQNLHIESRIVASLERISQAFRVLLWQESKEFSLSPIQVQILIFLLNHSEDKRKVGTLADEFNMTRATISDTVKLLEQKKLIVKKYDQPDARSFIINLSAKGKDIARQTAKFSEEIRKPVENLHSDDKENLLLSLMNIIRHLNQSGVITVQRMCHTCTYYQTSKKGHAHYCQLLNQPLKSSNLRIDCPEHELKHGAHH